MFTLCAPLLIIDLLAGGSVLTIGWILVTLRSSDHGEAPMDGSQRLIIQFTILGILAVLAFTVFAFTRYSC